MKRYRKRGALLALMLALTFLTAGCSGGGETGEAAAVTLPPVAGGFTAPADDSSLTDDGTVSLYLPTTDHQRLIARQEDVSLVRGDRNVKPIISALFAAEANETSAALGGQAELVLSGVQPIEVSGGICTVNLSASVLALEYDERYSVLLALASTLAESTDIRYINLLVADRALPFDMSRNLPAGSVNARPGEELPALWEQMAAKGTPLGGDPAVTPLTSTATLYFPLADGSGFVAEARNLSFAGQTPAQLTEGLLSALSSGAQIAGGTAAMPDLTACLIEEPIVSDRANGTRMVTLRFADDFPETLSALGVDFSCLIACVNWTVTTFIPQVGSVRILLGSVPLYAVSDGPFGLTTFEDGMTLRSNFRDGLRDRAGICLLHGERLTAVSRYPAPALSRDPAHLLALMMREPTERERKAGLTQPLPSGLDESDVLAVGLDRGTLLVNLSARFADAVRGMDETAQRMCCYAMADTLCELMGVSRVRFFWDGVTVDSLGTNFCWSGEFLLNSSIMENSQG
ncbi:MAG: GerMN domain-containing protein [Clostridia bacterium]|nr:GerMN domain-containing protein [Clostridia bacterium]